ncbi:MAG: Hint domain-containing protein [Paracoccaceae bacterium]
MGCVSGFRGVYAVEWRQTACGGEFGAAPSLMTVGAPWMWHGEAQRLDSATQVMLLDFASNRVEPRRRARTRLRRLALADIPDTNEPAAAWPATSEDLPPRSFQVTDGRRLYTALLVSHGGQMLVAFDRLLPPSDRELWITAINLGAEHPTRRTGVICFLPGTMIDTPRGAVPVEQLEKGDTVSTRDNGAQPLVWRGETRLSGAELYMHPELRPVCIRAGALGADRPAADLWVSPGHRLLMPMPAALSDDREVLVAAEDLVDGRGIRRDFALSQVRYIHLMFEHHEIVTANGIGCDSFHPGLVDEAVLRWHARDLERARPGVTLHPTAYGPTARRCLHKGEAAILAYAG